MPRPLPWIKLWLDSLHNQKLLSLSLAEQGAWWRLLALAGELAAGGGLETAGKALTVKQMARRIHLEAPDLPVFQGMVDKLVDWGTLAWNGPALRIVNWEERQSIPTSQSRDAIRQRVGAYRMRHRILDDVSEVLNSLGSPATGKRHEIIREALRQLAESRGLAARGEVGVGPFGSVPGEGRVDLVWYSGDQPEAAFEIEFQEYGYGYSIAKLGRLSCPGFLIVSVDKTLRVMTTADAAKMFAREAPPLGKQERSKEPHPTPPYPPLEGDGEGEGEEEGNRYTPLQGYERVDEARGYWKKALARLRQQLSRGSFSSYLEGTKALGYEQDGFLVVQVKATWQADNLNRSLNSTVRRALIDATENNLVDVRFVLPQRVPVKSEEVR